MFEFVGILIFAVIILVVCGLGALYLKRRSVASTAKKFEAAVMTWQKRVVNVATRRGLKGGEFVRYDNSGRAVISMYGRGGRYTVRRNPDKVVFLEA